MASPSRFKPLIPRLFASALVSVTLASATIAFAATTKPAVVRPVRPSEPETSKPLRVPDVTGEAYVFAKGILEDAGFAWQVGGAQGFAVNTVSGQSPAGGTFVIDTGAPTINLTLRRNNAYPELGTPENTAPYEGTPIVITGEEAKAAPKKAAPKKAFPSRDAADSSSAATAPVRLARPAFPPVAAIRSGSTTLALVSSSTPLVGTGAQWVKRNGLDMREYAVPGRELGLPELPSFVATEYRGLRLVRAIRQPTTLLLVYGRNFASGRMLVAVDLKGRVRYAFDFANYGRVPAGSPAYQGLVWAAEADGTLYVQTHSASPAKASGNENAYVTAVKLANRKVLWRSPALVANARRFELYGEHVVTGYGFTDESDYLYLLDRKTGEPTAQLLIPTAADHIVRKGSVLYVRTYDHELVAKLTPA
jgi:hypothetical protein